MPRQAQGEHANSAQKSPSMPQVPDPYFGSVKVVFSILFLIMDLHLFSMSACFLNLSMHKDWRKRIHLCKWIYSAFQSPLKKFEIQIIFGKETVHETLKDFWVW